MDGLGDGPGVGAATGAGSEDGAAVPRSSAPAQFVPEPVPAGAGAAALSAAVAAQAGASSPESAQQLSSIVVKSTSTLYTTCRRSRHINALVEREGGVERDAGHRVVDGERRVAREVGPDDD